MKAKNVNNINQYKLILSPFVPFKSFIDEANLVISHSIPTAVTHPNIEQIVPKVLVLLDCIPGFVNQLYSLVHFVVN